MLGRAGGVACIAAALVALALAAGGLAASPYSSVPVLEIDYNPDCTFTTSVGTGTGLASGTVLPPGPYDVLIRIPNNDTPQPFDTPACSAPAFRLSGPGVSFAPVIATQTTPATTTSTVTFQPSATYTLVDGNRPTDSQLTLSITATGTSSSLVAAPPSAPSSAGTAAAVDPIGSLILADRGRLEATVAQGGSERVLRGAKPVAKLAPGRYTLRITDRSTTGGLTLRRANGQKRTLSGVRFTGTHTVQIALTRGRWTFVGAAGPGTAVVVA